MFLRIAPLDPATLPILPPDIVWDVDSQVGDFAMAAAAGQGGAGGFQAMNPIGTAVTLLLLSDARCPVSLLKLGLGGDRRGWPGDGFDVDTASGETALGSYFFAMRRDVLTRAVALQFVAEAQRALAPLKTQKLCASIDVSIGTLDIPNGVLELKIDLYGVDGREVYAGRFRPLWNRAGGL